jgi:hypothetical protein
MHSIKVQLTDAAQKAAILAAGGRPVARVQSYSAPPEAAAQLLALGGSVGADGVIHAVSVTVDRLPSDAADAISAARDTVLAEAIRLLPTAYERIPLYIARIATLASPDHPALLAHRAAEEEKAAARAAGEREAQERKAANDAEQLVFVLSLEANPPERDGGGWPRGQLHPQVCHGDGYNCTPEARVEMARIRAIWEPRWAAEAEAEAQAKAAEQEVRAAEKETTAQAAIKELAPADLERYAAERMSDEEVKEIVTSYLLGAEITAAPRYQLLTKADIKHSEPFCDRRHNKFFSEDYEGPLTREQFAAVKAIKGMAAKIGNGSATVTPRTHQAGCHAVADACANAPVTTRLGVRVSLDQGGWSVSRELALPGK